MALNKLAFVLVMAMVATAPLTQAAITCGEVASKVASCVTYLKGNGGPVPAPCCAGARNLMAEARTTPDRQMTCNCLKTIARNVPGINVGMAEGLPGKCGFTSPFKISTSTDCTKVR